MSNAASPETLTGTQTPAWMTAAMQEYRRHWLEQWQQLVTDAEQPLRIDAGGLSGGLWQGEAQLLAVDEDGATRMTEHSMSGVTGWLGRFWELMAGTPDGIYIIDGKLMLGSDELS